MHLRQFFSNRSASNYFGIQISYAQILFLLFLSVESQSLKKTFTPKINLSQAVFILAKHLRLKKMNQSGIYTCSFINVEAFHQRNRFSETTSVLKCTKLIINCLFKFPLLINSCQLLLSKVLNLPV